MYIVYIVPPPWILTCVHMCALLVLWAVVQDSVGGHTDGGRRRAEGAQQCCGVPRTGGRRPSQHLLGHGRRLIQSVPDQHSYDMVHR